MPGMPVNACHTLEDTTDRGLQHSVVVLACVRERGGSTVACRLRDGGKQNQKRFARKLEVSVWVEMPQGKSALRATGTTGPP